MATYFIEPERRTLHGRFSRDLPPALTIDPGDSVHFRTLDAGWGLEPMHADGTPRRKFEPRDKDRDDGHALCGPIAIRGAQPGMTLAVTIDAIHPGAWGATYAGGWPHPVHQRLGLTEKELVLNWSLDPVHLTARNQFGHALGLRPFMGVLGMPPDAAGWHDTAPPRVTGGNLDCKELVAGSTLYLPIAVPGGLFSVGDGHAAQGDGEVCVTAIECPMEHVALTFHLCEDMTLTAPRANTPVGWITFGLHEDLNEAMYRALEGMLDLLGELHGLNRLEALALASLVADFRVTQIVNGVRGIHAVLPRGALQVQKNN